MDAFTIFAIFTLGFFIAIIFTFIFSILIDKLQEYLNKKKQKKN